MSIQRIQPPDLFESERLGFSQVVKATGTMLFIAGQVAWDTELQLVGGDDLGAQAEQALRNLRSALAAASATPADIAMLHTYIVDYRPEHAGMLAPRLASFLDGVPPPTNTLIGVESLAAPGLLIEIDAIAVLPDGR